MQTSLILLKPDTVERGNIGNVIKRLEDKGLKIVGMKMMQLDDNILKGHYYHVSNELFFPRILEYMTKTPVIALAISGKESIQIIRKMIGLTNPAEAASGSVRGDFGHDFNTTVIHASDSKENADRELKIFFVEGEVFEYEKGMDVVL